jgi:hypothetical protein
MFASKLAIFEVPGQLILRCSIPRRAGLLHDDVTTSPSVAAPEIACRDKLHGNLPASVNHT